MLSSAFGVIPLPLQANGAPTPIFHSDMFIPRYPALAYGDWQVVVSPFGIVPGYWSGPCLAADVAVLVRTVPRLTPRPPAPGESEEDSRTVPETWMSMTPMEIESQELGCRAATGTTVVMGMGMGWAAANAALRAEVPAVIVVERDPAVRELMERIGIFNQLPPPVAAKIQVVAGDALTYIPEIPVDTLLADIWRPLNGDHRVEQVRQMQANTGAHRVYFWGQEMVIARRLRAANRPFTAPEVAAVVESLELPLIGPEFPDYPQRIQQAAERWLKPDPDAAPA